MVSYWRSFEDLERFARSKDDPHLAAWQRFTREIGTDGSVGIYHETYAVTPGSYEAFYANMPLFGLAGAPKQAGPGRGHKAQTAQGRMHQHAAGEVEPERGAEIGY